MLTFYQNKNRSHVKHDTISDCVKMTRNTDMIQIRQTAVLTQHSQPEVYGDDDHVTEGSQYASVVSVSGSADVRLTVYKHDNRKCGATVAICHTEHNITPSSFPSTTRCCLVSHFTRAMLY